MNFHQPEDAFQNAEGYCRTCGTPLGIGGICAVCGMEELPPLPKFEYKEGMRICLKVGERIHIFDEDGMLMCGEAVDDDGQVMVDVPTCEKCLERERSRAVEPESVPTTDDQPSPPLLRYDRLIRSSQDRQMLQPLYVTSFDPLSDALEIYLFSALHQTRIVRYVDGGDVALLRTEDGEVVGFRVENIHPIKEAAANDE